MDAMLGKIMRMIVMVPAEWLGTLCDLLEKLTSKNGKNWFLDLKAFLRRDPSRFDTPVKQQGEKTWKEKDGIIYFTLPATDGTTGPQWIERLKKKNILVSESGEDVLKSQEFNATIGIIRIIVVLRRELFTDKDQTIKNVRAKGDSLGLKHGKDVNLEVACQIREMFTDKELEEMGLNLIKVMHEPIESCDYEASLLGVFVCGEKNAMIVTCDGDPRSNEYSDGFAFVSNYSKL